MIFAIGALSATLYLFYTTHPVGPVRSAIKTLSVASLALSAVLSGALGLCLTLALCSLGDLLLSRDGDRAFAAGVAAFGAGHLAYAAVFLQLPGSDLAQLVLPPMLWIAAVLLVVGAAAARLLAPRAGALRGPVLVYIPVILSMGLAALIVPRTGPLIWVLPAALAFMASDILLAVEKFLLSDAAPLTRITPYLVWVLYWGAQAGFLVALT